MENRILFIENIGKQYGIILFKKHCSINHVQIKRRFWCLFIKTSEKEKKILLAHVRGKLSDWHCLLINMSNTVMLMPKKMLIWKKEISTLISLLNTSFGFSPEKVSFCPELLCSSFVIVMIFLGLYPTRIFLL